MRAARRLGFAAVAVAAAVTGCSSNGISTSAGPSGNASTTPAASASTSASPAATSERAALLRQYGAFWRALTPASTSPAADRKRLLSRVAVDPELQSLLSGIARERSRGRAFYGVDVPRPKVEQLSTEQSLAVIDDCQDSSGSGVIDLSTQRKLTKGTVRNHVVVTLHRGADGIWRVAFVSYPKTSC
jgi:hypothetical protein